MNKRAFWIVALAVIFVAMTVCPLMAADRYTPNRNHSGNVGTSARIWQYGYFDKMIGDGTNGEIYGFKQGVKTVAASATLTAADIGKIIMVGDTTAHITVTLPTMAAGYYYNIINNTSGSLYVKPQASTKIMLISSSTGYRISNKGAGSHIRFDYLGTNQVIGTTNISWNDAKPSDAN